MNHLAQAFNAFNAKYLAPEEVAASFIPPPQYDTLTDNGHTMLVGPRGAGKTTLLVMLGTRALSAWQHPRADEVRAKVRFTGVHISTDLAWRGQVDATMPPMVDVKMLRGVGLQAFTTHVLHAVATTAHERVHPVSPTGEEFRRADRIDEAAEAAIAEATARAWGLDGPIGSFLALKEAMTDRSADLAGWLQAVREAALSETKPPPPPPIKNLEYASAALVLIERFNAAAAEEDARWALMFDELELAPETIRSALVRAMRGSSKLLLYKLSLAPHSEHGPELESVLAASVGNDYRSTHLSYPYKTHGYQFCRALLANKLGVPLEHLDEENVFGRSPFDTTAEAWAESGSAYALDSPKLDLLREQADNDPSFGAYLGRRSTNLDDPEPADAEDRPSKLRKLSAIALVRREFRTTEAQRERFNREERTRAQRTVPTLYSGATSLYAIVEGNPRWFMNLIDPLVDEYRREGRRVERRVQSDGVARTIRRFRAVLKALPLPPRELQIRPTGLLPILDLIGDYFYTQLVLDNFNPDPPGSFRIDDKVSERDHWQLSVALNAGAIVHIPDEDDEADPLKSLRGRRFRLAHLLAPDYRISLNTGRPLNLSTILERQAAPDQLRIEFASDAHKEEGSE
jgi:hypothetical protein